MPDPETLALELNDQDFELLLRARCRAAIATLSHATDGESSYNFVNFHFTTSSARWQVSCGKTYNGAHTSNGEVLSRLVVAATTHAALVDQAKMSLLAPPTKTIPSIPASEASQIDLGDTPGCQI